MYIYYLLLSFLMANRCVQTHRVIGQFACMYPRRRVHLIPPRRNYNHDTSEHFRSFALSCHDKAAKRCKNGLYKAVRLGNACWRIVGASYVLEKTPTAQPVVEVEEPEAKTLSSTCCRVVSRLSNHGYGFPYPFMR